MMTLISTKTDSMSPKWFSGILVAVLTVPSLLAIGVNLAADPFQIFFPTREEPVFLSEEGRDRYQHAGVVRHYRPESIIVGHSLAGNFQPTDVERLLGWRNTYNLTMRGSTIYEHRRVARFALEHSPVDKVLWLFFPANLRLPAKVYTPKTDFPEYLYDQSRANDLKFFATLPSNVTPYVHDVEVLRQKIERLNRGRAKPFEPRDLATNWEFLQDNRFNAAKEIEREILGDFAGKPLEYQDALAGTFPHLSPADIAQLAVSPEDDFFDNLERNLRATVADYPEVEFTIIPMPPLTFLHWQHLRISEPDTYRSYLFYVRHLVEVLSAYDNVSIFAYGQLPVAADIRLYRDHGHYHMAVNEYMLDLIARGDGQVTADDVDAYLSDFDRLLLEFRHESYRPVRPPGLGRLVPGKLTLEQARMIVAAIVESGA